MIFSVLQYRSQKLCSLSVERHFHRRAPLLLFRLVVWRRAHFVPPLPLIPPRVGTLADQTAATFLPPRPLTRYGTSGISAFRGASVLARDDPLCSAPSGLAPARA